jgi:glutamate:Na+ symporter, ESS family
MSLDLDPIWTLAIAIFVLYLGSFVNTRFAFLKNNNIPTPVVGGVLFALVTSILYARFDTRLYFDMSMKNPMMLMFFTTIGLGADLRMLKQGGSKLLIFALVCVLYLIIQNGLGLLAALSMDLHPLVGLLSASITLSGGHGTGAAYAQKFADVQNLAGAMELALACATFGLIIGGVIGGPIAGRLIKKRALKPAIVHTVHTDAAHSSESDTPISTETLLQTLFYVLLCLIGGRELSTLLSGAAFTLPSFVWCLFIGVAIRNSGLLGPSLSVHRATVEAIGRISLDIFLAMALMSLRLWELLDLAGPLLVLLTIQTLGMAVFASLVTFRVMGSHYDAAIVAGGHCGFGLGATPTAVANMEALTQRFGPSPQAFLIVPLMGAFFIDFLNAIVIQGYLAMPLFGF